MIKTASVVFVLCLLGSPTQAGQAKRDRATARNRTSQVDVKLHVSLVRADRSGTKSPGVVATITNLTKRPLVLYEPDPNLTLRPTYTDARHKVVKPIHIIFNCGGPDYRRFFTLPANSTMTRRFSLHEDWGASYPKRVRFVYFCFDTRYAMSLADENKWRIKGWRGKVCSNTIPVVMKDQVAW